MTTRRLLRRSVRSRNRRRLRFVPGLAHGQNYLAQALTAFRRAIRAHRKLVRLAPHLFDFAVVDQERREREERRRRQALIEPLLEKVYGPPTPAEREAQLQAESEAESLPKLHPRTERVMEREWANWNFWIAIGRLALARHHQRRPHAVLSFHQIAALMDVGVTLQRLACGKDSKPSPSDIVCEDNPWEQDLERAYVQTLGP